MRTLILVLLATLLCGCGDVYRYLYSGEVGWALKREIRDRHSTSVSIAQLTRFKWDELFIFGPYEPTRDVCRTLSLDATECSATITSESTDDGQMLMVFRLNKKVVHTEMHIRWHGDFTPVPDAPFTPATAQFDVAVEGKGASGEDWIVLKPHFGVRSINSN